MNQKLEKKRIEQYYDQVAKQYSEMYKPNYKKYPANLIRLNFIIKSLHKHGINDILDAGCGTAAPMIKLLKKKFCVKGFDFSKDMVKIGKRELEKAGYNANLIFQADLTKRSTLPNEKFDAILALGVFPHIRNEIMALKNMRKLLKKNGKVFIEFRNELFSLYSMNNYTIDFLMNKIIRLEHLPRKVQKDLTLFYSNLLHMSKSKRKSDKKISYLDILAKFHNPLIIENDIFTKANFKVNKIHFYHYHALPPIFEKKYPSLFRILSLKIEKTNDWKGYFLCSAFVVEATKN